MKRRKLFEINYVLNSFFYLMLTCFQIIESLFYERGSDILAILAYLIVMLVLVVAPFNWSCYTLYKCYKNGLQLSGNTDKIRITVGLFFNLLTALLLGGIAIYIHDYFIDELNTSLASLFYYALFCGFTITSIYLSINYWIIRKQVKLQAATTLSNLGEHNS